VRQENPSTALGPLLPLRELRCQYISTNGAAYCTQQDGSGSRVQVQHCRPFSETETAGDCGVISEADLSLPVYHIQAVRTT
jgi:hypothetical protein